MCFNRLARMGTTRVDWVPPERFDEYRLIKALGRGSMGQVWLAHDTVLDRRVAVKFLSELPADSVRERFLTEARAAARVQHPNVIAIYRVGQIGARPYLISEYVRGRSLDRIARPVAWPRLYEIALGLARGLAAAHRRGVLHRDLKPANAILSATGEVKLLDFGLAKLVAHVPPAPPEPPPPPPRPTATAVSLPDAPRVPSRAPSEPAAPPPVPAATAPLDEAAAAALRDAPTVKLIDLARPAPADGPASSQLTRTDAVMGTPAYMPPESWRGEPATPRADVYSLGALLHELAAGLPPHRGDSEQAVRSAALDADAPSLAVAAPGIDPRFAAIVDRCLRRDPEQRFASGDAVRQALEAIAALPAGEPPAAGARAQPGPDRAPRRRRARTALAAIAAVVVVAGFAGLVAYRSSGREPWASPSGGAASGACPQDMVAVPAGRFQMGSPDGTGDADEHPQHPVALSAYCIDRTEVTVAAYAACAAAGVCGAPPLTVNWSTYSAEDVQRYSRECNRGDHPDHPINCIDWGLAAAYCAWRDRRLPSEAEWEYAARGDDGRIYPWGNAAPSANRLNSCGRECAAMAKREAILWRPIYDGDDGWEATAPVGRFPDGASRFGALDMAGNVWEWTGDWYGAYPSAAETDPHGAPTGTSRVSRGGGWSGGSAASVRAADRDWLDPEVREASLGFRCARAN